MSLPPAPRQINWKIFFVTEAKNPIFSEPLVCLRLHVSTSSVRREGTAVLRLTAEPGIPTEPK